VQTGQFTYALLTSHTESATANQFTKNTLAGHLREIGPPVPK